MRISVIGAGAASAELEAIAEEVGREIALAGAVLVCGGLGGVMAAAARGAAEAGGLTVGLLPGSDASAANPWIGLPLPTGMGEGRNVLVVRAADAVIAVGGAWGTLSEIAFGKVLGRPTVTLAEPPASGLGLPSAADAAGAVSWALEAARRPRGR